jgi:hypothetical protein
MSLDECQGNLFFEFFGQFRLDGLVFLRIVHASVDSVLIRETLNILVQWVRLFASLLDIRPGLS